MSRLVPGTRIRCLKGAGALLAGATATILHFDSRYGYEEYWKAWPDDEELCNPGTTFDARAWCIADDEEWIEVIREATIEELLTSEHQSWREHGKRLLKKEKRFSFFKRLIGK